MPFADTHAALLWRSTMMGTQYACQRKVSRNWRARAEVGMQDAGRRIRDAELRYSIVGNLLPGPRNSSVLKYPLPDPG
jgi:hypothetical protein